jgi:hypothetical protein
MVEGEFCGRVAWACGDFILVKLVAQLWIVEPKARDCGIDSS